jgi:putative oxidoreductase
MTSTQPPYRSSRVRYSEIDTASAPAAQADWVSAARAVTLVLRWVLVIEFVGAAAMKLTSQPEAVGLFTAVGLGQWFRFVVGSCELIGAMLLAYRRTIPIGALWLAALMVGAAATEVLVLDRLPISSGATLIALLTLAALASWRSGD